MLQRLWKTALAVALCAAAFSPTGLAQLAPTPSGLAPAAPPSILQIDLAAHVLYFQDTNDLAAFGTLPNATPSGQVLGGPVRNFYRTTGFADIVAVNGQQVTGSYANGNVSALFFRTAPTPGQAIANTVRNALGMSTFEILKSDGTPIGTIMAAGLAGGAAPPSAPTAATANELVIIGGTGAFLGARGQISAVPAQPGVATQRNASIREDPANRRLNGGGTWRLIAHIIPMERPEVLVLSSGAPAITHSIDFGPVNASNPAAQGEMLSAFVKGLGPVVPRVDPGQPFPSRPLSVVNSPVEVTVNGKAAEVLSAVGFPGAVDAYQVNFRVPPETARGQASIRVSAAWIAGPDVRIPIQ